MARKSNLPTLLVLLFFCCALGVGAFMLFRDMDGPVVSVTPQQNRVSPSSVLKVDAVDAKSKVKSISVGVRRDGRFVTVAKQDFSTRLPQQTMEFTLKDSGLSEGAFELEVQAADDSLAGFGQGNHTTMLLPMRLDTTPPRTTVKTSQPYVRTGGSAVILFTPSEELSSSGVQVGDLFFPAYKQGNGDYICFFAFPYNMEVKDYKPELVAVDLAGNKSQGPLSLYRIARKFTNDTINLSDDFVNSKEAEFAQIVPGQMTPIERFLKVNGDVRRSNARTLLEIGHKSAPTMLWQKAFLRLPNSAARARFADHRTYMYKGVKVDEQTHLGFDLASLAQAQVPAANSGKVVFASYLGIYGNMVVIDHGLGLQSLYSHMSELSVSVGQEVQKGDILGRTGATGMAGGDHLHFGILISGLEVTPLEWLDDHWINDNIITRLKDAGAQTPEFAVENAAPEQPQAPAKPAAKPAAKTTAKPAPKKR